MKRVLIGCEYTATVRDAFRHKGFDAWSCDILPTEGDPAYHLVGDVKRAVVRGWDLIILHPPCTAMALCGNKHYGRGKPKHEERIRSLAWTLHLAELAFLHSSHVAIENPASVLFPEIRKRTPVYQTQYIQPWQFGHPEQKKTGFARYKLPPLQPTRNVYEEMMQLPVQDRERIFRMPPSDNRGQERSRFYSGFAEAMADQWGRYVMECEQA